MGFILLFTSAGLLLLLLCLYICIRQLKKKRAAVVIDAAAQQNRRGEIITGRVLREEQQPLTQSQQNFSTSVNYGTPGDLEKTTANDLAADDADDTAIVR